jgi:hypothetical protein
MAAKVAFDPNPECPDLCLFWGSMQMHSGRLPVNIDFQSSNPWVRKVTARRGDSGD